MIVTRREFGTRWLACTLATAAVLAPVGCASDPGPSPEAQQTASAGRLLPATSPDGHRLREVPASEAPTVRLQVREDPASGWNLHVITERFRFAPERTGQQARPQEGHAHLYLDGEKIARLYGPWYHLAPSAVPHGEHTLTVSLTANDHTAWAVNGEPIQATATITGTGEAGHDYAKGDAHTAGPEASPTPSPEPTASPEVSFTVTITGDTVSPTLQRVNVQRGQVVRLEVRSDRENTIHIHGYDLERPVKPDQPAVFVFTADQTGLFEVEAHHPTVQLLQLLVR